MKNKKNPFEEYIKDVVYEKTDVKKLFVYSLEGLTTYIDEKIDCEFDDSLLKYLCSDEDEYKILNEKMNNLIKLINNMDPEERVKFIELDIETELWDMI